MIQILTSLPRARFDDAAIRRVSVKLMELTGEGEAVRDGGGMPGETRKIGCASGNRNYRPT